MLAVVVGVPARSESNRMLEAHTREVAEAEGARTLRERKKETLRSLAEELENNASLAGAWEKALLQKACPTMAFSSTRWELANQLRQCEGHRRPRPPREARDLP